MLLGYCHYYTKKDFFKENTKPLKAIKTTTYNYKLHNREALRKLHIQLEIPSCLGYDPKSYKQTYKAAIYRLKSIF